MEIREVDGRNSSFRRRLREKINELRTYQAKVGVFGVTGVGKSSLCNALFGADVAKVSDVSACTREPQQIFIGNKNNNGGIHLIDVPGVGETTGRDEEYFELYKSLMPELDLVIWVIKADDRAYSVAERAYKEILLPHAQRCPTIFIINQVDKINPVREWNTEQNCPGETQLKNILEKEREISKAFDVSSRYIQTCSVVEHYNLIDVMNKIIEILPKEKKFAFVREAKEEIVTEQAVEQAERGIWETVKEWAGDKWKSVASYAKETILETWETYGEKIQKKILDSAGEQLGEKLIDKITKWLKN